MEWVDIYNEKKQPSGVRRERSEPLSEGEYRLIVFTVICNRQGEILLTLRAPEKQVYPNFWGHTGGAAQAGENSRQAIAREVLEETGIRAAQEKFELLFCEFRPEQHRFTDFYFLRSEAELSQLVMQAGETVQAMWASPAQMDRMIAEGKIAPPDAEHWPRLRKALAERF